MRFVHSTILFIARLFLSAIFIASALHKIINFDATLQYIAPYFAAKGITTNLSALLIAGCIVELLGGLSVLLGLKPRLGALALFVFLIPTTYIFHDFWDLADPAKTEQMAHFMKNLAIAGGLLYVVACGCHCHCHRCCGKGGEPVK